MKEIVPSPDIIKIDVFRIFVLTLKMIIQKFFHPKLIRRVFQSTKKKIDDDDDNSYFLQSETSRLLKFFSFERLVRFKQYHRQKKITLYI